MARNATGFSGALGVRVISVEYSAAIEAAWSRVSVSGVYRSNVLPCTLIAMVPDAWGVIPTAWVEST